MSGHDEATPSGPGKAQPAVPLTAALLERARRVLGAEALVRLRREAEFQVWDERAKSWDQPLEVPLSVLEERYARLLHAALLDRETPRQPESFDAWVKTVYRQQAQREERAPRPAPRSAQEALDRDEVRSFLLNLTEDWKQKGLYPWA